MRYRVVIIVAVCYMVGLAGTMTEFSIPPLTPIFQRHLHILAPSAGLLMSLFALATVITALPAGSLTHRFGAKTTGMAGLGLSAAGALALIVGYGQADFGAVLAARFVSGMGFGLISVAAPAAISQQVPARHAAKAMGVWATWVPVGSVVMFVAAPHLVTNLSVRPLELVLTVCDLAAFLAMAALRMERPARPGVLGDAPQSPGISRQVLVPMLWVGLAFACFTFSFFAFNTWVTTFFTERFHMTLVTAGLLAALISVVNAGFNILSGMALGHPRTRWYLVFVLPAWILAALWVVLAYSPFAIMLAAGFLTGALGGVIPTLIFAAPGRVALTPRDLPLAMSIVIIGENIGIILGPPIFGAVIRPPQFVAGFFVLAAVSVAMALALGQVVKRVKSAGPEQAEGIAL